MKKFAAFVVGMSMSTIAFAGGPELQVSCYEQVLSITGKVKETHNLYRGKMPLGTLRLASKADAHNKKEYHLDFSANGMKGGQLEIVIPAPAVPAAPSQEQQGQGKDQSQCQMPVEEVIPGECYEIAPPAPEQDCNQGQQQQQQGGGCSQDQGQSQQQQQQQGGCATQQGQNQGQSQQQQGGTCELPAAPADMAHVKLSADRKISFTAMDAADSSGASLEANGTASLKVDHHRGHLGLKVVTTCDVQYLGGL